MIMLILTPYILVSSLVPSCKLFLIQTWVLVFALSNIGRAFAFYSSHLCSCGSTLGDIFWAMVRALSIFITVMLLPVSCLNPSSTTINSENFAHLHGSLSFINTTSPTWGVLSGDNLVSLEPFHSSSTCIHYSTKSKTDSNIFDPISKFPITAVQ